MNTLNERGTTAAILENKLDAFTLALKLAITAPTAAKERKATRLAEEIALMLTQDEISRCKKRVIQELRAAL